MFCAWALQACSGGQLLIGWSTPAQVSGTHGGGGPGMVLQGEGKEEEEQEGGGDEEHERGEGFSTADSMDAFCSVCHELFDSPVKTPCGHVFCQVRLRLFER